MSESLAQAGHGSKESPLENNQGRLRGPGISSPRHGPVRHCFFVQAHGRPIFREASTGDSTFLGWLAMTIEGGAHRMEEAQLLRAWEAWADAFGLPAATLRQKGVAAIVPCWTKVRAVKGPAAYALLACTIRAAERHPQLLDEGVAVKLLQHPALVDLSISEPFIEAARERAGAWDEPRRQETLGEAFCAAYFGSPQLSEITRNIDALLEKCCVMPETLLGRIIARGQRGELMEGRGKEWVEDLDARMQRAALMNAVAELPPGWAGRKPRM